MLIRWSKAVILALLLALAVAGQARPAQDDARLDILFGKLQVVGEPRTARMIELAIWQVWGESGSATVDLLMEQAAHAMARRHDAKALGLLDSVIEQLPGFAEGWNKRATLYYMMGRMQESRADIERTLELEPRHFGALSGLGLVNTALEDDKGALNAYLRALEVNPNLNHAKAESKRLRKKIKGEGI